MGLYRQGAIDQGARIGRLEELLRYYHPSAGSGVPPTGGTPPGTTPPGGGGNPPAIKPIPPVAGTTPIISDGSVPFIGTAHFHKQIVLSGPTAAILFSDKNGSPQQIEGLGTDGLHKWSIGRPKDGSDVVSFENNTTGLGSGLFLMPDGEAVISDRLTINNLIPGGSYNTLGLRGDVGSNIGIAFETRDFPSWEMVKNGREELMFTYTVKKGDSRKKYIVFNKAGDIDFKFQPTYYGDPKKDSDLVNKKALDLAISGVVTPPTGRFTGSLIVDHGANNESEVVLKKPTIGYSQIKSENEDTKTTSWIVGNVTDGDEKLRIINMDNDDIEIQVQAGNKLKLRQGNDTYAVQTSINGTSANRPAPAEAEVGERYFDTDLNEPVYFDGAQWIRIVKPEDKRGGKAFDSSVDYKRGDLVSTSNGLIFKVLQDVPAGGKEPVTTNKDWLKLDVDRQVAGKEFDATASYQKGDIISFQGNILYAKTHIAPGFFDPKDWDAHSYVNMEVGGIAWSNQNIYKRGDIVTVGNQIFSARKDVPVHTPMPTVTNEFWLRHFTENITTGKLFDTHFGYVSGDIVSNSHGQVFVAKQAIQAGTAEPVAPDSNWDELKIEFTSGIKSSRPIDPGQGFMFFDSTLGKPVWCKDSTPGSNIWVDATGTQV